MLQSVRECYRVLQSITGCLRVLQSVIECYRMLQSVTECYSMLQSVTECYRVFLAHLLGPISGLVILVELLLAFIFDLYSLCTIFVQPYIFISVFLLCGRGFFQSVVTTS